jgi:hypothetical protein
MNKPRVFLSYAREDAQDVEALYRRLADAGTVPWMDTRDLLPGQDWDNAIQKAIVESDFFLACLSTRSVDKRGYLQRELERAREVWGNRLEEDTYLIPVRLDDCAIPTSLRRFQWVDLYVDDGFTRLLRGIRAEIAKTLGEKAPPSESATDRPKYFYYVSTEKIEMLLPQLVTEGAPATEGEPLVTKALRLVRGLEQRRLVSPLSGADQLSASAFYSGTGVWRHGLYYFRTFTSETVAYFVWKRHSDGIIILAGSPDNVIGRRTVSHGVRISSTGDAIESLGSMDILEAIITDEVPPVVVGGADARRRLPAATKRLFLARDPGSTGTELRESVYTHSRETGLAIFCLDPLRELPETTIETVFRIYSTTSARHGSFYGDLQAEHEEGRQAYPTLYTDAGLSAARKLGLQELRTIYIGSPIYTALGG